MTAAAFTFLLRPFSSSVKKNAPAHLEADIYKDQLSEVEREQKDGLISAAEAEAAKIEISRRILDAVSSSSDGNNPDTNSMGHKKVVLALLALVPIVSVSLYLLVGQPNYLRDVSRQVTKEQLAKPGTIEVLTQKVEAHLKKNPDDLKGWLVLARAYANMGRAEDAKRAFANINRIQGKSGDIASLPPEQRGLMIKAMVAGLHQKLKRDGNDVEGWQRLIRSYMVLGQKKDAVASYLEARKALSDNQAALAGLKAFAGGLGILKEIEKITQ